MIELNNEKFFPLIFDSIPHGIFTINADGLITSFNNMAEKMTEYKKEEVIGRHCHIIFQADLCQKSCPLKSSITTLKSTSSQETTVITKSGNKLMIELSTAALIDDNGTVLGGVEMFRDISLVNQLNKQINQSYILEDIASKNSVMKRIMNILPAVANNSSTVLIEGETGTEKNLIARVIHNLGSNRNQPFLSVNCAGLPDNILEAELFGCVKGVLADIQIDKPGRFSNVKNGTIYIDEINELSAAMQVKLYRVLEERLFEPIGAVEPKKMVARVIASSEKNLAQEVTKKRFRKTLYNELNIVRIVIPPLRERREDITLLIQHFIKSFNLLQSSNIKYCSKEALSAFMKYDFPSNIRELKNAIEHAFVVCKGNTIQIDDLPLHIIDSVSRTSSFPANYRPLEEVEADTVRQALILNNGNRNKAAVYLGVSRNTLWRKMKRYGIKV